MADETSPTTGPAVTPGGLPAKPKRKRGTLNQEYSDELAKTGRILKQATEAKYAQIFVGQEVDPQLLPELPAKLRRAEELIAVALQGTANVGDAQDEREDFRGELIAAIDPIRTAAKRKYRRKDANQLKAYFVGEALETNKADLRTIAKAILARLQPPVGGGAPLDKLPGIDAASIQALADALADYEGSDLEEEQAQGAATGSRMTLGELIRNLRNDRIELQLAVDQSHPWRAEGSAEVRSVFELPLDRPLSE